LRLAASSPVGPKLRAGIGGRTAGGRPGVASVARLEQAGGVEHERTDRRAHPHAALYGAGCAAVDRHRARRDRTGLAADEGRTEEELRGELAEGAAGHGSEGR